MTHRWTPEDVRLWRVLANVALVAAADAERSGTVSAGRLVNLKQAAKRTFKARFPAPEGEWPRLSQFLRLCEDYAGGSDAWRRAWTAALDTGARALLARLGGDDTPPAAAKRAAGGSPWWLR